MLLSWVNLYFHHVAALIHKALLFIFVLISGIGIGYLLHLPEIPIHFTPLPERQQLNLIIEEGSLVVIKNDQWNIQGNKEGERYSLKAPLHFFTGDVEVTLTQGSNTHATEEGDTPTNNTKDSNATKIVASKNGTKYYYPSCSSAARIKAENLVSFSSEVEAENAGYAPSECVQQGGK